MFMKTKTKNMFILSRQTLTPPPQRYIYITQNHETWKNIFCVMSFRVMLSYVST